MTMKDVPAHDDEKVVSAISLLVPPIMLGLLLGHLFGWEHCWQPLAFVIGSQGNDSNTPML